MVLIATTILGGPGKGVFQLLDRLKERDVNYVLVAYKLKGSEDTEFITRARNKGYQLEVLEQAGLFNFNLFRSASHILKKHDINIIQSHGYKSHLIAFYLRIMYKAKWLSFVHGWTTENIKMRLYNGLEIMLVRFSNRVVAVSPSIKNVLTRWYVGGVQTILNAIDKNEMHGTFGGIELRQKLNIGAGEFVIGTIGRLSPEKGHKYLIEAIAKVKQNGIKLLIVGGGPLTDSLAKLCNELGLSETVIFCGHKQNIRDYYEAINLLVLPSLKEGLPNVVLEAMIMNVPVISTDVGGIREIITDGYNGWIIEAGSAAAIANKLNEVIDDKKQLASITSRLHASVIPKFCPDSRAEEVVKIYKKLMQ